MTWTLWRYISKDLLVTFTLALAGLTTVLALAGVLVRMRQEGLDSQRIALLFAYLLPVMLTITLPFASLFSATLVYGRLSSMNEINACRASGISVGTLMYPALGLAILTGVSSVYMAMYSIPRYTREVEVILRRDIERVVMAKMRSRGTALLQGHGQAASRLFADWADPQGQRPLMRGVLAIMENNEKERQFITADEVELGFDQQTGAMTLRLTGSWGTPPNRQYNADGILLQTVLPPQFTEKVKYRDLDGLLQLADKPTDDPEVRGALSSLVFVNLFQEFFAEMTRAFAGPATDAPGQRIFTAPAPKLSADYAEVGSGLPTAAGQDPPKRHFRVRSPQAIQRVGNNLTLPNATVEVYDEGFDSDPTVCPRYQYFGCAAAVFTPQTTFIHDGYVTLRLRLDGIFEARERTGDVLQPITIRSGLYTFEGLDMVPTSPNFATLDYYQVYRLRVPAMADNDPAINFGRERVEKAIRLTGLHIDAELHSRLAMGVCCLLFVFLGAGLGVMSRSGDYVIALALSAAPGAITLGVIVLGRRILINMDNPTVGVLTIWGGPALLLLANVVLYRGLLRR